LVFLLQVSAINKNFTIFRAEVPIIYRPLPSSDVASQSIEKMKKGLSAQEIKNCYKCHTTGYGKPGGFQDAAKSPELKNAGCEVCHGPGGDHAEAQNGKKIRRRMDLKVCEECHTSQRIQSFKFKPLIHAGAH
jgi:hypothetical protein